MAPVSRTGEIQPKRMYEIGEQLVSAEMDRSGTGFASSSAGDVAVTGSSPSGRTGTTYLPSGAQRRVVPAR